MEHDAAEELLAAYALDALDADEAAALEEHLATCPRCRAELARHEEVAAALGNFGAEAPEGLWDRIAGELAGAGERPPEAIVLSERRPRRRAARRVAVGLAGVAAAAIVVLGLEVSHLNGQLNSLQQATAERGLAPLIGAATAGTHQTVELSPLVGSSVATVVVSGNSAYWIGSSLPALPGDRTYQVWALADGRVVSIGLLGPDPNAYSRFRVEKNMTKLMLTAEPLGGTVTPTTPVLVAGTLPTIA